MEIYFYRSSEVGLKSWWNNLEWQSYKVPNGSYTICSNELSIGKEVICLIDKGNHLILDTVKMEWLYKMLAYQGYKVRGGIDQEVVNVTQLLLGG